MITYLINQGILVGFNIVNVQIDAYKILHNKRIAHGINFAAYALFVGLLCWLFRMDIGNIILFCVSAFCNRQFSFDIPLNIRRGLKWDYVSLAKPPKSILDRIEISIWGYDGRSPVLAYAIVWMVCFIIKLWM